MQTFLYVYVAMGAFYFFLVMGVGIFKREDFRVCVLAGLLGFLFWPALIISSFMEYIMKIQP